MAVNVLDVITDEHLLGPFFAGPSWSNWRLALKATFGLSMTKSERVRFREMAERDPPPGRVREAWFDIGRRGGKDSVASAIAMQAAVYGQFERYVRPGERPVVLLLAATKEQAAGLLSYVKGYFAQVPMLQPLLKRETGGLIELTTGCDIQVAASDFRSIRGRTVAVAVLNEIAFWRDDSGRFVNPDSEVYSAILPSLMTLRKAGSMLIGISSVYRKQGLLYQKWVQHHGKDDPNVLVIRATSRTFNPTIDQVDIDADMALDPDKARAEWLSEWRTDISGYIDRQLVERLVDVGVRERAYDPAIRNYVAFSDEAGGSGGDASTLCIVHLESGGMIIQDVARRWVPPFTSSAIIAEKAALLKTFRLPGVTSDHWAGGLPPSLYRECGIRCEQSAKPKAQLYLDFLHILNSGRIKLLDDPVQVAELCGLERRVAWGGKESIDHAPGGRDDAANALAGAAFLAATTRPPLRITPEMLAASRERRPPRLRYARAYRV